MCVRISNGLGRHAVWCRYKKKQYLNSTLQMMETNSGMKYAIYQGAMSSPILVGQHSVHAKIQKTMPKRRERERWIGWSYLLQLTIGGYNLKIPEWQHLLLSPSVIDQCICERSLLRCANQGQRHAKPWQGFYWRQIHVSWTCGVSNNWRAAVWYQTIMHKPRVIKYYGGGCTVPNS